MAAFLNLSENIFNAFAQRRYQERLLIISYFLYKISQYTHSILCIMGRIEAFNINFNASLSQWINRKTQETKHFLSQRDSQYVEIISLLVN